LLGSSIGASNVDAFSQRQFDLLNPNTIAQEGDKFRYHFKRFLVLLKHNLNITK